MNYDAPNAFYDAPNAFYDMASPNPTTPPKAMKKIKLSLQSKTPLQLHAFADHHGTQVDGAPSVYTSLIPIKADYDDLLEEFDERIADVATKQTALDEAVLLLEQKRVEVENALRSRANRVETIANGDEAIIVGAGFEVANSTAGSVGELPAPQNLKVTMSEISGRLDVRWQRIKGAKSYIVECRTHGATPGAWQQAKLCTAAKCSITGLTAGQEYAFRVRALGAAGEGPWSDEAVKMSA